MCVSSNSKSERAVCRRAASALGRVESGRRCSTTPRGGQSGGCAPSEAAIRRHAAGICAPRDVLRLPRCSISCTAIQQPDASSTRFTMGGAMLARSSRRHSASRRLNGGTGQLNAARAGGGGSASVSMQRRVCTRATPSSLSGRTTCSTHECQYRPIRQRLARARAIRRGHARSARRKHRRCARRSVQREPPLALVRAAARREQADAHDERGSPTASFAPHSRGRLLNLVTY